MTELPLEAATQDVIARYRKGNDMLVSAAAALRRLKERVDDGDPGAGGMHWNEYRFMHLEQYMTRSWINKQLRLAPPGATKEEVAENVAARREDYAEKARDRRSKQNGDYVVPGPKPTQPAITLSPGIADTAPLRVEPSVATPTASVGHTSDRPLIEIRVIARNEWQIRALEVEPTTAEEAKARYFALGWEGAEFGRRWHELEAVKGKVLEDARRFFPNSGSWKAWLRNLKTCPATTAAVNSALSHAKGLTVMTADDLYPAYTAQPPESPEPTTPTTKTPAKAKTPIDKTPKILAALATAPEGLTVGELYNKAGAYLTDLDSAVKQGMIREAAGKYHAIGP
jgi:hypothetical protein